MTWWLSSRRAPAVAWIVLGQIVLVLLVGGALVPAPSLVQGAVAKVPAVVFLPLIANVAVQYGLDGPDRRIEQVGVRSTGLLDAAVISILCISVVAAAVASHALGAELVLESARNTVGYLGLGLVAWSVGGARIGALLPAAYVLILVTLGGGQSRLAAVLEWPLQNSGSAEAAVVAGGVLGLGLLGTARGGRTGS